MRQLIEPRRLIGGGVVLLALAAAWLGAAAPRAAAAGQPVVGEVWASSVFSTSARLQAQVNPNGFATGYHFDYITETAYQANLDAAKDPFAGASRIPSASDANIGAGTNFVSVQQQPFGLAAGTGFRYRVVAKNGLGTVSGPTLRFATQAVSGSGVLPDSRGWEMVSPVDKNGGQVDAPGALAGGGVLQAAADGQSVTYGSATSFGSEAVGAATASQYVARRGSGGWSTQNITAPLYSGSYNTDDEGVPYRLFSPDLARGLLLNGRHCRGEGNTCAVPNPPLAGTDAPAGYQNFYLREGSGYTALLGAANAGRLALPPARFELGFAGSSPDLRHPVLTSCAALTANATETPLGEGCDPALQNLYMYNPSGGLTLVNVLPAQSQGTAGASLAAQAGAVSASGSRVYWRDGNSGNLYLRDGSQTQQVDLGAGGGGEFQTAAGDGSVAYYTKAGHLYRFTAAGGTSTDLTPSGDVEGVLGASADGSYVYYLAGGGIFLWHGGVTTEVAAAAEPGNAPPATGTARVSADGTRLAFVSSASLTEYDNEDLNTGLPDSQVFLYEAGPDALTCVSCNPTFERPVGSSTLPGSTANGTAPGSVDSYKPRALSDNGKRVYFESGDAIAAADTNGKVDVYQWEAQGFGDCGRPGGCIALISSGRAESASVFVDASGGGADVFFLTDRPLVGADTAGSFDLYDARVGGGIPESQPPIPCEGDACQPLAPEPVDPTLTTLLSGPGNPAIRYPDTGKKCKKGRVKRKGKCVKKKSAPGKRRNRR